jgi:hypothetical protein
VSHSAQYFGKKWANLGLAQECGFPPNQTACQPLSQQLAKTSGDSPTVAGRNDMHPEEIMKPDLLSEIVLLTFGTLILLSLALFVVATLARS